VVTKSLVVALLAVIGGCSEIGTDSSRWFDKSAVIKAPEYSPLRPIEIGVSAADYTPDVLPYSTPPREDDLQYRIEDYVIGQTDVIDITIMDLYEPGQEALLRKQVSTSGNIDLPLVGQIKCEGRTANELKQAIISAYSPDILRNPTVAVSVVAERQSTFTGLGAVARPGQYPIPRKDTKLLEAIGILGGIVQTNIDYIYVIRPAPSVGLNAEGKAPTTGPGPTELPSLPTLPNLPSLPGLPPLPGMESSTSAPSRPSTGQAPKPSVLRLTMQGGGPSATSSAPVNEAELKKMVKDPKWVYVDGRQVAVDSSASATGPAESPVTQKAPESDPFGWHQIDKSDQARVIAINLKKLHSGAPMMNILVRNNDIIWVPPLEMGEFYVMGEVQRPGVYSLAGRKITVKMAIAAAGNLGPLSDPKNAILIRRIGDNQEQAFPLDIEAIFRSEQNDMFLKPDDVIAVGQSWTTPFLLVFRNAFRMTYGFGWIWDRNFADPLIMGQGYHYDSTRFTHW